MNPSISPLTSWPGAYPRRALSLALADLELYGAPELYRSTRRHRKLRERWCCTLQPWDWPDSPTIARAHAATPLDAANAVLDMVRRMPSENTRS